ncbi:unnamed protein product [Nesidiocoris tenuis]|uniref:Uncharacterized protein n=1 Tax=Nesidiocoris tenuis TaxID=355587 RepID=A0A6H5HEA4_9HEMI|nr:unnamed protein product [Nesidiocoris tenuis]CAB0014457.1 unnamed protein product [Nesidiocoris tenuis]
MFCRRRVCFLCQRLVVRSNALFRRSAASNGSLPVEIRGLDTSIGPSFSFADVPHVLLVLPGGQRVDFACQRELQKSRPGLLEEFVPPGIRKWRN